MTTSNTAAADTADDTIEQITADRSAHYEPFGWHHWPEYPVARLPIPPRARRNPGRWRRGQRGVSGRQPHDPRRSRKLAHRVDAHRRPQLDARARRRTGRPHPHRDELLPARRRLLPTGRIPSRSGRPAPATDLRENGSLLEEISRPAQPAGRSGRYPLRGRQADLRLFRARAVSRRPAARADLHGRPRIRSRTRCGSCRRMAACSAASRC